MACLARSGPILSTLMFTVFFESGFSEMLPLKGLDKAGLGKWDERKASLNVVWSAPKTLSNPKSVP